jgi:hypothetical protein
MFIGPSTHRLDEMGRFETMVHTEDDRIRPRIRR